MTYASRGKPGRPNSNSTRGGRDMTEKLGNNFRGKAEAVRVLRDYVKIKQGHNVIILTDNAVRKLARMAK